MEYFFERDRIAGFAFAEELLVRFYQVAHPFRTLLFTLVEARKKKFIIGQHFLKTRIILEIFLISASHLPKKPNSVKM